MSKKGLALTAIVMAIVLAFTTIRQVPVEATSSTGSGEQGTEQVTENKETDLTVSSSDEDFLAAVEEAKNAEPITDIASVLGYQSEELNSQLAEILAEDDVVYFAENSKIEKDGYTVYPFVITHSDGDDSVWFITDQAQDQEFNAELAIQISCLSEEETNTITYTLDEQAVSAQEIEPQTLTENEEDPADGEVDELVPDTGKQCSTDENGDPLEGNTSPSDQPDGAASNEDKLGETPDAPSTDGSNGGDNIENNQGNVGDENQDSGIAPQSDEPEPAASASLTRTCLLTTCTVNTDTTAIKPILNKKAELSDTHNTKGQNDYDITLTVTGDSYTPETDPDPVDVVFVVDASNSMDYPFDNQDKNGESKWTRLYSAMGGLVDKLLKTNIENKISVVAYAGAPAQYYNSFYNRYLDNPYSSSKDYDILISGSSSADDIKKTIKSRTGVLTAIYGNDTEINGGTNSKAGFIGALQGLDELAQNDEQFNNRTKYIVYLSDGLPTLAKEYNGEYSDEGYTQDFNYNSKKIDEIIGNGFEAQYDSTSADYYNPTSTASIVAQAKDVASRVSKYDEKTKIITIGIGSSLKTGTNAANLLLDSDYYAHDYRWVADQEKLDSLFDDLANQIGNEVTLTSLDATDVLSEYVDFYEDQSIIVNGVDITPSDNPTDENTILYQQEGTTVAYYKKDTKTLQWNVASALGRGQTATLTYHVHTTEAAIPYDDTYKEKLNCYPGDPQSGTHASDNEEGEDTQYGYRSNAKAFVTYKNGEVKGTSYFDHPVVQSTVKGTLTISKTLADDYKGISENQYRMIVALTSDKINDDTFKNMGVVTTSENASCKKISYDENDKSLVLEILLGANESVSLSNLPINTRFTVQEDTNVSDKYYKVSGVDFQLSTVGQSSIEPDSEDKEKHSVSGHLIETGITGEKTYDYYTIKSMENGVEKTQYYYTDNDLEITDKHLIEELKAKGIAKGDVCTALRKLVGPKWIDIEESDKVEPVDGKYLVGKEDPKSISLIKGENTYFDYDGNVLTDTTINGYKDVTKLNVDLGYEYTVTMNGYTFTRPCEYRGYNRTQKCNYYSDPDSHRYVWGNKHKVVSTNGQNKKYFKVSYTKNGFLGDYTNVIYLTLKEATKDYYLYNNKKYYNQDDLCTAIKADYESPKGVVITRERDKVTYYEYSKSYDTLNDYLIGEKNYQNTEKQSWTATISNFSATGANASVQVKNTMELRKANITLIKELVDKEGNPKVDSTDTNSFVFRFENVDTDSPALGEVFYQSLTIKCGVTDNAIEIKDIPLGKYKVTEQDHMRYELYSIDDSNDCSYIEQKLLTENQNVPITFKNYKVSDAGFSDSSVIENVGSWKESLIKFISKIVDGITYAIGN